MTSPDARGSAPLAFLRVLIEEWRVVTGLPLLAAALAVAISFVMRPSYTATVTFAPEARDQRLPAGLAGLAGQFGLDLGLQGGGESPQFYASVSESRSLLEALLNDTFMVERRSSRDTAPLIAFLRVQGSTEPIRVSKAVKRLRRMISSTVNRQTNEVRLTVTSAYSDLSAAVANRLVEHLNRFNVSQRRSRGHERHKFVEQRLADSRQELRAAEERLRTFLERNRRYENWPGLRFEYDRLQREVQVQQEIYMTLSRELEQARIQEVNETPVLTTIDPAAAPVERASPARTRMGIVALLMGGVLGMLLALGRRYRATLEAEGDQEWRALTNAWQALLGHLRGRPKRAT